MVYAFIATHEHWIDHLGPVWRALPEALQGPFYTPNIEYAEARGIAASQLPTWPKFNRADRVVICGEADRRRVSTVPTIRFEHGCGISYGGVVPVPPGAPRRSLQAMATHHSYAGGRGQRNVVAFCNPNTYSNDRWVAAYPNVPSVIVGSPKMDPWHRRTYERNAVPVVAVSFHADFTACPETRSTFDYYRSALIDLAKRRDIRVVAHVHPRARAMVEETYRDLEYLPTFDEVLEQADVYVVDNSSTLYEFASTDRPVVILNAPFYRRDVHHGLRFWEHSDIGPTCETPRDLCAAVDLAIVDPEPYPTRRARASEVIYPHRGEATARAAEALMGMAHV